MAKYLTSEEAVEMLNGGPAGVERWNAYRRANPEYEPDLNHVVDPSDTEKRRPVPRANLLGATLIGANLSRVWLIGANMAGTNLIGASLVEAELETVDLSGAILTTANLSDANLWDAHMRKARLMAATLRGADLCGADLTDADLRGADLSGAQLDGAILIGTLLDNANLSGASVEDTDLSGANLDHADLRGTCLRHANLTNTKVGRVRYDRRAMIGLYSGIRVATCHGNPIFKRDAEDQDFIDTWTLKQQELGREWLARLWGWFDYGRSWERVAQFAAAIWITFSLLYLIDWALTLGLFEWRDGSTVATPFYYSVVTFSTLGYGDIYPVRFIGELCVFLEVILGYVTLGLLLSVLANKFARRA